MKARTSVELDGHKELSYALQDLPIKVAKVGLRKAVNAGSQIVVRAYRANLSDHRRTGLMRKAVKKKIMFYERSGNYVGIIGTDRGVAATVDGHTYVPAYVAHMLEGGVKPHVLIPKSGPWAGRTIKHPGVRKTSPLQRAVDSTAGAVKQAMSDKLAQSIQEAAAKYGK